MNERSTAILAACIGAAATIVAALMTIKAHDSNGGEALRVQEVVPAISHDLSGEWYLINTIKKTTYNPYRGLRLKYRILLQQVGNRLEGTGEKIQEDDREIAPESRTPIYISGTVEESGVVKATCREEGRRRTTTCTLTWKIVGTADQLQGAFISTAANVSGESLAKKTIRR